MSLPAEIIQKIISYTADFTGMESLLSASSWVNTIFQAQPRRITLDLIKSNPITTMPEIQQLLRNIAIIESPSTSCTNLENYLHICMINDNDSTRSGAPDLLPDQITTPQIFHIIHIAANIQCLACMCLYIIQQNFISAVTNSLGSAASQRAAEPIVWIEEYRVCWTLWHLQHYSALRKTAKYRWRWPNESVKKLADTYTTLNNISAILPEQMWTVSAILADLGLRPLYGHSTNKKKENEDEEEGHEEESSEAAWEFPTETPIPFFSSLELPPHHSDYPTWSPPPVPDANSKIEETWSRTPRHRFVGSNPAGMIRAHTNLISRYPGFEQSWREIRQIRPFRRIGVMLWNRWRMYSVGLYSSISRGREVCTPDGDVVQADDFQLSPYDVISRWLALVGKPPPDVGKNYENGNSTLARYINPH